MKRHSAFKIKQKRPLAVSTSNKRGGGNHRRPICDERSHQFARSLLSGELTSEKPLILIKSTIELSAMFEIACMYVVHRNTFTSGDLHVHRQADSLFVRITSQPANLQPKFPPKSNCIFIACPPQKKIKIIIIMKKVPFAPLPSVFQPPARRCTAV